MFADDLTVWKTSSSITKLADDLSDYINNTIDPWAVK
jgi:hypothetical protein